MLCVVSIVDSISATSMPINEFVIYRSQHNYEMEQVLIVCDKNVPHDVIIPPDVRLYLVGQDYGNIRLAVKEIKREFSNCKIVYHAHHQKSALLFFASTIGLNIRAHVLYTVHSTFSARDLRYKISSCVCALLAKFVNCVSDSAYDEYSLIVRRIKGRNFLAIQNGVDVDRIDSAICKNTQNRNRKRLICVGRMIPLKNHRFLIELLRQLPECTLVLIGAEDKEGKTRLLAEKLGVIDRVEFKGLIPREAVFAELNKSCIYVSASLIEGLPVSVLEAMRAGLIPVISQIKPHDEIKASCDSVNVLPLDIEIWREHINKLINLDSNTINHISFTMAETVKNKFSLDVMHNQYLKVYEKL